MDDIEINTLIPNKRGRKPKSIDPVYANSLMDKVITSLSKLMPKSLAQRIVASLLLSFDVPNEEISKKLGLQESDIANLKEEIKGMETYEDFIKVNVGEHEENLKSIEDIIVDIHKSNPRLTYQEIVDIIYNSYGLKVRKQAVSIVLKENNLTMVSVDI